MSPEEWLASQPNQAAPAAPAPAAPAASSQVATSTQTARDQEAIPILLKELEAAQVLKNAGDTRAAGDVDAIVRELAAKGVKVNAAAMSALAPASPAAAPMSPEEWAASQPKTGFMQGFFEGIAEQVTGRARATPETQALPEWVNMPELNQLSVAGFKTALGTLMSNPEETVQVLQANFPSVQVRQDAKGNYIFRSSVDQKEYAITPGLTFGDVPRVASAIAAFTPAGRALTIPGAVASSGATQAVIEASQAATGGEFNLKEVALGAATGPAGQIIQKVGTPVVQAVKRGIQGRAPAIPPAAARGAPPVEPTEPPFFKPEAPAAPTAAGARQLPSDIEAARQAGITLMTSDVVPPRTFASKWLQTIGERIPGAGTGGVRQAQQTERIEAVRNVLREFGADDAARAADDVMKDLATKRGADLAKYTGLKTEVIERLGETGIVPMTKTVQAIDEQIAKLQGLKTQEVAPIIERLTDWKAALQGQNLINVETLRKQIGESFKAPELASVRGIGEKSLSSIYKPLKQDMEAFITQVGERRDVTKYKVANKRLADLAGELDMSTLKSVLRRGDETPEVIANMLFSKKPSEVRQLYASLTPTGRASARAAILSRAAEKATVDVAEGTVVSPDKFANEVKRLGTSVGVFFNGDDLKQVEGLIRVLNITKRASEAAAAPPTGVQAAIPVSAAALSSFFGGGLLGFIATLGGAGSVGVAARIYESAPIRNLLIKIPQTTAGSKEEAALLKSLTSVIQSAIQAERQFDQENQ